MDVLKGLQLIVGLGLLNVWLVRSSKATAFRGAHSKNLKEEFAAYGLPPWAHLVVGSLKVLAAVVLLVGIVVSLAQPVLVAAATVAILMVGALAMHLKVRDPINKSVPALLMLLMSGAIVFTAGF